MSGYKKSLEGKDKEIFTEVERNNSDLEKEIFLVRDKQQEIQRFISIIESNISFLETELNGNKKLDYNQKVYIRRDITKNIEMINELYNTFRGFEEVKFKYKKAISENNLAAIKLIEVQVRQLNDRLDKFDNNSFMDVLKEMSNLSKNTPLLTEDKFQL